MTDKYNTLPPGSVASLAADWQQMKSAVVLTARGLLAGTCTFDELAAVLLAEAQTRADFEVDFVRWQAEQVDETVSRPSGLWTAP